jgi:uncharacterized protein (UPF0332 family)
MIFGRHALAGNFASEAGRSAYMAAYHAAQAFIAERTGTVPKTHSGTRSEFTRLAQTEPKLPRALSSFLGRAYELKAFADYSQTAPVGPEAAKEALDEAAHFIQAITNVI